MLEHIQGHRAGFAGVHVPHIFARPAECLSRHDLEAAEINPATAEEVDVLFGKIFSHDANKFDGAEIRCGDGPVGGRAAEEVFVLGELGFDIIQRDGSNNKNGHRRGRMRTSVPLCEKKHPCLSCATTTPGLMTTATAAAGRRGWSPSLLHDAESTTDDAPHGFAGFGVLCERFVRHALLEFKNAGLAGFVRWNGFVNVGGHSLSLDF